MAFQSHDRGEEPANTSDQGSEGTNEELDSLQDVRHDEIENDVTISTAIRDLSKKCRSLFESCQDISLLSQNDWIDQMSAKFNWWSLGIGAEKSSLSSLDSRVQDRADVRGLVISLLESLQATLLHTLDISDCQQLPPLDLEKITPKGNPLNTSNTAPEASELEAEFAEQLYYIKASLDSLSRISAGIKKSGTKFRHQRADALLKQRGAELSTFRRFLMDSLLIGPTEYHLLSYIHQRSQDHPERSDLSKVEEVLQLKLRNGSRLSPIQSRLIQANLTRRNRMEIYRKKLEGKSCPGPKVDRIERIGPRKQYQEPQTDFRPEATVNHLAFPRSQAEASSHYSEPATRIASSYVPTVSSRSEVAKSVTIAPSQGAMKQDYPKCPVASEDFFCPYCAQPLDSTYSKSQKRWRRHVTEDISPYVCLFLECNNPDALYVTTEDWKNHMREEHSIINFVCNFCWVEQPSTESFEFDTEGDWLTHIRAKHWGEINESDMAGLMEVSQRTSIQPVPCPLCHQNQCLKSVETDDHIEQHLHSFALQSLPWDVLEGDPNASANPEASIGSEVGSRDLEIDSQDSPDQSQWYDGISIGAWMVNELSAVSYQLHRQIKIKNGLPLEVLSEVRRILEDLYSILGLAEIIDTRIRLVLSRLLTTLKQYLSDGILTDITICDNVNSVVTDAIQEIDEIFGEMRGASVGEKTKPENTTTKLLPGTTDIGMLQKGGTISLPVGEIHGIATKTEFSLVSKGPEVIFSIYETHDLESKAIIVTESTPDLSRPIQIIPHRWGSERELNVTTDPNLGSPFLRMLHARLRRDITSEINCREGVESIHNKNSTVAWFRLRAKAGGNIDIFGPKQLLGYEGPVRGWTACEGTEYWGINRTALAIVHLFRFGQILQMKKESQHMVPFQVTIDYIHGGNDSTFGQPALLNFRNRGSEVLYFSAFVLGPGFCVERLWPAHNFREISEGEMHSLSFTLTVPNELTSAEANDRQLEYRFVIRAVVTNSSNLSLKSLEMPNIWNLYQWAHPPLTLDELDRGRVQIEGFRWWIQDEVHFIKIPATTPRRPQDSRRIPLGDRFRIERPRGPPPSPSSPTDRIRGLVR